MIRIDHISFELTAPDERFAQELYADWDGFCLHCFTRVAEECLAPYDDHEMLLEMERLDLDIGSIPEEDFYDEFPRLLRETLLKALPPQETLSGRNGTERNAMSRIDNLLYYLEHGHPVPEWTDRDFDPQAEAEWMAGQSGAFHTTCMDKLSLICLRKEHALRRLLWQTDNGKLMSGIYATVLAMTSAGIQEKRRFLALLLEEKPEIPVEFVHSTRGDGELRGMADLLDNPTVGSIIRTETAEHAEVDLPPYWHYLYGWLIRYYPYNGIAMFGGKNDFIRHLHLRLLTYIRRRNHSFYLSKEGLTESFLLEVFGSAYYMDVLNAIYHLQPHNADGTPVYDGYLNMELYRIFTRLSLLRRADVTERDDDGIRVEEQGTYRITDTAGLTALLEDTARSDAAKRAVLTILSEERPELLVKWLRAETRNGNALLSAIAELMGDTETDRLLAFLSVSALRTVTDIRICMERYKAELAMSENISDIRMAQAVRQSVLQRIAATDDGDGVESLLLKTLSYPTLPETVRHRAVARFRDAHRENTAETVHILQSAYKEWLSDKGNVSYSVKKQFESCRKTAEGFAAWIGDTAVSTATKREWLREATAEKTREWLRLLRTLPQGSGALASLGMIMTAQDLLEVMAKTNFHHAAVLSRTTERLLHHVTALPLSFTNVSASLEILLRKALLRYMQDTDVTGMTWTEEEITDRLIFYLHLAATGKENYESDTMQWRRLAETLTANGSSGDDGLREGHIARLLSAPSISRTDLQQSLIRMMDNRPDELQEWIEQEADKDDISKLGGVSDGMIAGHWAECLAATAGFAHSGTFRRLAAWLRRWMPASELATALFLYVKEPGWRTFTPERMETFFFSRVTAPLSFGTLTDGNLTESMRKVLFRQYLRRQPEKLTTFIRESVSRNTLPLDRWIEWTETSDWLYLAASLSLAKAELLLQMADGLSLTENERKRAWAAYISYSDTGTWAYDTPQKTIRDFIRTLPSLQYVEAEAKEEAVRKLKKDLKLAEEETPVSEDIPEILPAGNAGLCLLAPWLVRLFSMLGYLDGDKRTFKDTASKIRAVFLLQYTVYGEEREHREPELAFNRLLTALPANVPLPKRLPMTEEERETADGMVAGVKNNWPKMDGTSVAGFRRSFIARDGMLEQEDARWLLTVEDRAYDILLDTVPWGFRQIRLPWLKKHIQVRWHERQVF